METDGEQEAGGEQAAEIQALERVADMKAQALAQSPMPRGCVGHLRPGGREVTGGEARGGMGVAVLTLG